MTRVRDGAPSDPPFSRPLEVENLQERGLMVTVEADRGECERLAKEIGIAAIAQLRADFKVQREGAFGVHLSGEMRANVRQRCVVSLEPFDADIVEPVDLHFLPEAELAALRRDDRIDPLSEVDPPDPIKEGKIDLGEIAAEFLVLGLDPYPRKPGAVFSYGPKPPENDDLSAFAVLQKLKKPEQ
jgi:Large ribosomal RNA subunit accumulation protein YceD